MRVCGIIAEYDPLHNGHAWHLREAKRLSGAEYIVCVLSGCFTQRGMPALLSPHIRARMALEAGADIVLQPPFSFSVCNGERFALGGISVLRQMGAESLCFGAEPDSIPLIEPAAELLEHPTASFQQRLRQLLSEGNSFPKAQGTALAEALNASADLLALPNAALAICYARINLRLNAGMRMLPVPRSGQYHSDLLPQDGALPSATAVRAAALSGQWEQVKAALPPSAFALLKSEFDQGRAHMPDALTPLLRWKLRTKRDFSLLPDLSEGVENRLSSAADCLMRDDMVMQIKSRRYSYARINRLLTHALTDTDSRQISTFPRYAYILGFRKEASRLLKLPEDAPLRLYSAADPNAEDAEMRLDIRADDLWALGANQPFGTIFREKPVIL